MKRRVGRDNFPEVGVEGALYAMALLPTAMLGVDADGVMGGARIAAASAACLSLVLGAIFIVRRTWLGRSAALIGIGCSWASLLPWMYARPFVALAVSTLSIFAGFLIAGRRITVRIRPVSTHADRCRQRSRWGAAAGFLCGLLLTTAAAPLTTAVTVAAGAGIGAVPVILALHWAWSERNGPMRRRGYAMMLLGIAAMAAMAAAMVYGRVAITAAAIAGAAWLLLPGLRETRASSTWLTPLIDHPARMLVTTFSGLCAVGTGLLMLPAAGMAEAVAPLDAVFTSVSAVCVTGLIVLDTPRDFSAFGHVVILLLIQLGGLGIMSISTTALHVLGKRMTLRQERLLHAMNDGGAGDLIASLVLVVKFTLLAELLGAILLLPQFLTAGDSMPDAVWRAAFTAISAYCNAGFALQSDSLASYSQSPWVLHTVGVLIIAGGMSPAVALAVPRWLRGRPVPAAAHLVLVTTTLLLLLGILLVLALEWQGTLAHLDFMDKLHNAWFQSLTLRTAGFNSIDIAAVSAPMLMLMMLFMFIGGSPGGTAGGVKTSTVAVLALAMWANISGRRDPVVRNRRIPPMLVYRAVAVIGSGIVIWLLLVLSLTLTQAIPVRDLVFEATSALGTVGLSTGATGQLDGIGKVLIVIGMFLGRVGPLTLFMLLGEHPKMERQHRPDVQIPIS